MSSDSKMQKWEESAKSTLKSYYCSFSGTQFDKYDIRTDKSLLLAKICFAMFGMPTKESTDNDDLSKGYPDEQRDKANEIMELILKVYRDVPYSGLLVGIIFVACKQDDSEYVLPIFSVFASGDPTDANASRRYVDTTKRSYKSWTDWKENNTMPMVRYAYPKRGYFTCSTGAHYDFDEKKEPDIEFGNSPACDVSSQVLKTTDIVTAITSLGCGVLTIASFFTPIGPAVMVGCAIAGTTSAVYGTGRAINRLVDKGQHDEDLADLESFTLWFSIAATPLHFTSSWLNATLVRGATTNGRIFSSTTRMFATILNFGTLGVDGVLLGFGLANLIEKGKKDQLTTLDVLQFSMSVFFFSNTLIKPQMASRIIENAQDAHIQQYANSMTDTEARTTFEKFIDQNKGSGSIVDKSKIVRTINRIDDPNALFRGLKNANDIKIGGRKGKTLLVNDQNNNTNRINPNRILFQDIPVQAPVNYQGEGYETMKKCLNKDPNHVKVRGKNIFAEANLNDRQKRRIQTVVDNTAHKNQKLMETSLDIAERMGCDNVDDVLSIVEIVSTKVFKKGIKGANDAIKVLNGDVNNFISGIKNDVEIATALAQKADLKFVNPLNAVYHYRKHGTEFAAKIKAQPIEVYLCDVPKRLITDANLVQIDTFSGGAVRKCYITDQVKVAFVIESAEGRRICTMYHNPNWGKKFEANLAASHNAAVKIPDYVANLHKTVSNIIGIKGADIYLNLLDGSRVDWKHFCNAN